MKELLGQIDISQDELNIPKDVAADSSTVEIVLELAFGLLGMIAFIVIIIAGLQFVLSRGEPEKAAKARRTIIYAAVGLVIAVSAFTLVQFVTETVG